MHLDFLRWGSESRARTNTHLHPREYIVAPSLGAVGGQQLLVLQEEEEVVLSGPPEEAVQEPVVSHWR